MRKSSKLIEINGIFKEVEINFDNLNEKGIKDMITIIRK